MERRSRIDATGALMLLGFAALMGINQPWVKIVNEGLSPMFQAGLRSACALPLVLGFALFAGRRLGLRDGSFWPGILSGLFFAAEFAAFFHGVQMTSIAHAATLFYTMPVWTAIGAHFLIPGDRLTPRRMLGLVLALCGVAVALSGRGGGGDQALLGDLLCLGAAFGWTGIALLARASPLSRASPEMQLVYQLAVSAPVLLALAPLGGPLVRDLTLSIGLLFAVQVVLVVCVGFLGWFWVLKVYPASDMAAFGFLSPLFGLFFGWLLLDEPVTLSILGALALVGFGIFLTAWKPRPR